MSTPEVCDVLTETIGVAPPRSPSVDMPKIVLRSPSPPETDVAATIEIASAANR